MNIPMSIGQRVEVVRKKRVVFEGELVGLDDDSDQYIGNVEEWARVKDAKGMVLVFRRSIQLSGGNDGWLARSKVKAREWGFVVIKPKESQ